MVCSCGVCADDKSSNRPTRTPYRHRRDRGPIEVEEELGDEFEPCRGWDDLERWLDDDYLNYDR